MKWQVTDHSANAGHRGEGTKRDDDHALLMTDDD